jgi:hypothetical protein
MNPFWAGLNRNSYGRNPLKDERKKEEPNAVKKRRLKNKPVIPYERDKFPNSEAGGILN